MYFSKEYPIRLHITVPVPVSSRLKDAIKRVLPRRAIYFYRLLRDREDALQVLAFLRKTFPMMRFPDKLLLVDRIYRISDSIECPHTQAEILQFIDSILSLKTEQPGVIVEAGCYKGGSTAKFSLATAHVGRTLLVFDSFEGIPAHNEEHDRNIFGESVGFPQGSYCGDLHEVRENVQHYGNVHACKFYKGWFAETLPTLDVPVAAAYLDVDLASSTYTCLKHIYPLLIPRGEIFSQDGHLPLVIDVFRNQEFWYEELGCPPPDVEGLGHRKLIRLQKPALGDNPAM